VIAPTSRAEAVDAFGDGSGVTVLGGGTILMPELNYGRLRPDRVLMLQDAGLSGIARNGSSLTIGAMTTVAELEELPEPLGTAARNVADHEIRGQATLGGNLCAPAGGTTPRGDLQAALIALGAQVKTAGKGGERMEPIEDFVKAGPHGRCCSKWSSTSRSGRVTQRPTGRTLTPTRSWQSAPPRRRRASVSV
jgi:CO/xanthine dehydrogenase FAD-binding subunit